MAYHNESTESVLHTLGADPNAGLTVETAAARLSEYGENRLREKKKKSTLRRFLDQFKDVMILILLAAAAAGLGALAVYCRRAQEQRDRIEEKLDALMNKKGDTDENT